MTSKEIVMLAKQKYDDLIKHKHSIPKEMRSTFTQTETDNLTQEEERKSSSPPSLQDERMFVQQRADNGIPGTVFSARRRYTLSKRPNKGQKWLTY